MGLRTNQAKGRELESWLKLNKLNIHNLAMITSLRSKTIIDLVTSTVQEASVQCKQLPYNGSDHFTIFAEFNDIVLKHNNNIYTKINWNLYTTMFSILGVSTGNIPRLLELSSINVKSSTFVELN
ncbi:unnamed protein product [Rotaria magnacalcarata]|uniref:Endonuclease/exonuclease/phosphatase domain-containing protein n=1 Tax=Rotaria magnacalcarata TaxID=392030 RepID=A0A816LRK6_9BILA|nr:unnamed protein product [Rotaria magnacalcarata]CAF2127448.1 unnamed protein product [Rotaria magnacalcarata]